MHRPNFNAINLAMRTPTHERIRLAREAAMLAAADEHPILGQIVHARIARRIRRRLQRVFHIDLRETTKLEQYDETKLSEPSKLDGTRTRLPSTYAGIRIVPIERGIIERVTEGASGLIESATDYLGKMKIPKRMASRANRGTSLFESA